MNDAPWIGQSADEYDDEQEYARDAREERIMARWERDRDEPPDAED